MVALFFFLFSFRRRGGGLLSWDLRGGCGEIGGLVGGSFNRVGGTLPGICVGDWRGG